MDNIDSSVHTRAEAARPGKQKLLEFRCHCLFCPLRKEHFAVSFYASRFRLAGQKRMNRLPRAGIYNRSMKIISVNVGLPQTMLIEGKPVETGIFKHPVSGAVKVARLNFQGDQQADLSNHGGPDKAVYAYSWENILYWRRRLRREEIGPGWFGENLTVEDLLDDAVAIGDQLIAGTARFQVAQPRLPCSKLEARMGMPGFAKLFLESGRTGFYMRVLEEGFVSAGDSIGRIEAETPRRVTDAEFIRLHRDHEAPADLLQEILKLRAVPERWKDWVRRKFALDLAAAGHNARQADSEGESIR